MPVHYRATQRHVLTACGVDYDAANELATVHTSRVDCPACRATAEFQSTQARWTKPAKRRVIPVSPVHFESPSDTTVFCGEDRLWKHVSPDWDDVTCPACVEKHLKPARLSSYIHAHGRNGNTLCGIDGQWQVKSSDRGAVTCPGCRAALGPEETAGPPAVIHHATPFADRTTCGLERWDNEQRQHKADVQTNALYTNITCPDCRHRLGLDGWEELTADPPAKTTHLRRPKGLRAFCDDPDAERRAYGVITRDILEVDCRDCLRVRAIEETAGPPAVTNTSETTHQLVNDGRRTALCGIPTSGPGTFGWFSSSPELVTCAECITITSREAEFNMSDMPEENHAPESVQERVTSAHRHDWSMVDGPKWPHDCEGCTFLGHQSHDGHAWDLYYCSQSSCPTVIARRGEGSDYVSGLDLIDHIPILALAYVRAVQADLHQPLS